MANPNSLLTKIRFRLVRWLDASPDVGEAWCIDCGLNNGRTLIVPAPGHSRHVGLHRDQENISIAIRVNWGQVGPHYDDEDDD